MKRILFLVSSMEGGGAERVAALLSNHWVEQGHLVTLMPTFSGGGHCVYPLDQRVRLDHLADRVGSRSRSWLNKLLRLFALRRAIRELAPDVVLSFLPHVNVAAILTAAGMNVPVVVSERIYPPAMPLGTTLKWLRKWTYPKASAVVVQTAQAHDWLARTCPKARGYVVANPVIYPLPSGEPMVPPTAMLGSARRVVLAVGRLSDQKQFDCLIRAFASLAARHREWDLVILGEGPERPRLELERDQTGLSDRVHLPGRVGNLADWYARADFFVMSSRFEGFPNALTEAMAHKLPGISFDCNAGPRDIIRDGVDGYLVPPEAGAPGLTRAMDTLMQNDELRTRMAHAAAAVHDRFSMQRIAAEWDTVLGLTGERNA